MFECTGGEYQPFPPTMFFCEPAVALLVSDIGEREIISADTSTKCDQQLTTIPELNMVGHSVNLLDNLLILGASNIISANNWWFRSLNDPRAGLRSNRWDLLLSNISEAICTLYIPFLQRPHVTPLQAKLSKNKRKNNFLSS